MKIKISLKHIIISSIILIIVYNLFVPDDFIKKSINPKKYWSERVEALSKNINYFEKSIDDFNMKIATKDYNRKIKEMTFEFSKQGISPDSSRKLAFEICEAEKQAEKDVLNLYSQSLANHRKLLKEAKNELNQINNSASKYNFRAAILSIFIVIGLILAAYFLLKIKNENSVSRVNTEETYSSIEINQKFNDAKEYIKSMQKLGNIIGADYNPGLAHQTDLDKLMWCKTCKHYRKIEKYESELWMYPVMLFIEYIPCKIHKKTKAVWEKQFSTQIIKRSLFPQSCKYWEKQDPV